MMQRTSWKINFDDCELQADFKLIEESSQTIYLLKLAHTFSEILPFVHVTGSRKNGEEKSLQTKLKTVLSVIPTAELQWLEH